MHYTTEYEIIHKGNFKSSPLADLFFSNKFFFYKAKLWKQKQKLKGK